MTTTDEEEKQEEATWEAEEAPPEQDDHDQIEPVPDCNGHCSTLHSVEATTAITASGHDEDDNDEDPEGSDEDLDKKKKKHMTVPADAPWKDRMWEVFTTFWPLGLVAFGGPQAHVAILRDHLVEQRDWLDEEQFTELFAIGQVCVSCEENGRILDNFGG